MIRWILPASVALHVGVIATLPSAAEHASVAWPSVIIEVAAEPPPERAPEPPASAPAPTPLEAPRVATTTTRAAALARAPTDAPRETSTSPTHTLGAGGDGPVDFTSTVLSGEGVATGIAAPAASAPTPAIQSKVRGAAAAPRFVPVGSLARPPRAPGLDTELERNYPIAARRAGVSGKAVLRVRILPDGRLADVQQVSESYPGFADACARTVRAARWEPPIDGDGRPAATEITYVCRFEVRS